MLLNKQKALLLHMAYSTDKIRYCPEMSSLFALTIKLNMRILGSETRLEPVLQWAMAAPISSGERVQSGCRHPSPARCKQKRDKPVLEISRDICHNSWRGCFEAVSLCTSSSSRKYLTRHTIEESLCLYGHLDHSSQHICICWASYLRAPSSG